MKHLLMIFLISVAGTDTLLHAATPSSRMPAEFDILTRKSIFSNQPGRITSDRNRGSSRPNPPAGLPVLVGIAREEGKILAIVEDPATGKTHRLLPGDTLPQNGGTIANITLDAISIKSSGDMAQKQIQVGQNISGSAPTFNTPSEGATSVSESSGESGTSTESALPPGGSIEERMRLRRLQQQGEKK